MTESVWERIDPSILKAPGTGYFNLTAIVLVFENTPTDLPASGAAMQFAIPNLRHLRVFLEVARHRSISKAAPRVFLSQPAITQAIGKLETLLENEPKAQR